LERETKTSSAFFDPLKNSSSAAYSTILPKARGVLHSGGIRRDARAGIF
jgi:hypothetical protein